LLILKSWIEFLYRRAVLGFGGVAVVAIVIVVVTCIRVWTPDFGLTRFIPIGNEFNNRGIEAYRTAPKYVDPYPANRWGFDGQLYAELSLDPLLRDPQLNTALDNPPYRAHRILLPWLAWIGGLGRPSWVLNVYAALNPLFWLGYIAILFVLFRRHGWFGVAGFAAMLLTCGVVESTCRALTDFPSFVLMIVALMMGGLGGAGTLALAALSREVNLLGVFGFLEFRRPWRFALKRNILIGLLSGVPLLLWFAYVAWRLGPTGSITGGNLDWPLHAIFQRLADALVAIHRDGFQWSDLFSQPSEPHAVLTIVATLTQCLYVLTHPKWDNRLWRVGAIFVPYFLCVSFNVWGGTEYFTVTRHALPITLAFNLLLAIRPSRLWLLWFVLGNCFVPAGVCEFIRFGQDMPHRPDYTVEAAPQSAKDIVARFGGGWAVAEQDKFKTWRWATEQRAILVVTNTSSKSLQVQLGFRISSLIRRDLRLSVPGATIWSGAIDRRPALASILTPSLNLPPGDTEVTFSTPQAPVSPGTDDPRSLTFRVTGLVIKGTPAQ
jgi:hypothetical protein